MGAALVLALPKAGVVSRIGGLLVALVASFQLGAQDEPAVSSLPAIPAPEEMTGTPIFHGAYIHYIRGRALEGTTETWINRDELGAIRARGHIPFFKETTYVVGDAGHRPVHFALTREAFSQYPSFVAVVDFDGDTAVQSQETPGDSFRGRQSTLERGAIFDYNARPDSYVIANLHLRRLPLEENASIEFTATDWGTGPDGEASFSAYRVRYEYKGKEEVAVPAGKYSAHRVMLTQLSKANTWYKKGRGHITEFWVLDNYVIVRLVRHREPYEVQLAEVFGPESLPGYLGESTIVPVFIERHDHAEHSDAHSEH